MGYIRLILLVWFAFGLFIPISFMFCSYKFNNTRVCLEAKRWVLVHGKVRMAAFSLFYVNLNCCILPNLPNVHTVSNQTSTTIKMKQIVFNWSDKCTFIDLYVNEHKFVSEISIFEVFSYRMALAQHHKEDLLKSQLFVCWMRKLALL